MKTQRPSVDTVVTKLAEATGWTKTEAKTALCHFTNVVTGLLAEGVPVKLPGVGVLAPKEQAQRSARNPRTGEAIVVPAKTVVKFKADKSLSDAL
ncbi:HU family DNA-binding protein [Roseibium sp. Sym1]|uniref:HU family DNA-binding protein n=1 Tax=Roseibium sp. Sym1 TaxID=3016006 RepID=UPI0022B33FF2|nr:HU family DNA-binding protein [Roseibium sp. Sym1]